MPVPTDDPLDILLLPPPDETPTERTLRLDREAEAKRVSLAIDASIKAERAASRKKRIVRLLLLGQSESGKSTTLRQFQRLYTPTAFREERILWRAVIQLNIVRSIRTILDTLAVYQNQMSMGSGYNGYGTPTASPYASPKARSRSISRTRQSPQGQPLQNQQPFHGLRRRGSEGEGYGSGDARTYGNVNANGGPANGNGQGQSNILHSPPRYPPPLPPTHGAGAGAGSSSSSASSSQRAARGQPQPQPQPQPRYEVDEPDEYAHDRDEFEHDDEEDQDDDGEYSDDLAPPHTHQAPQATHPQAYPKGSKHGIQHPHAQSYSYASASGSGSGSASASARKASPSPSRVYGQAHGGHGTQGGQSQHSHPSYPTHPGQQRGHSEGYVGQQSYQHPGHQGHAGHAGQQSYPVGHQGQGHQGQGHPSHGAHASTSSATASNPNMGGAYRQRSGDEYPSASGSVGGAMGSYPPSPSQPTHPSHPNPSPSYPPSPWYTNPTHPQGAGVGHVQGAGAGQTQGHAQGQGHLVHNHQHSSFSMHSTYTGQTNPYASPSVPPTLAFAQHSSYAPSGQYAYANSIHSSSYAGIPTNSILYPSSPGTYPTQPHQTYPIQPNSPSQSPQTYASTASSSTLIQTPLDALRIRLEPLKEVERVLIWRLVSGGGGSSTTAANGGGSPTNGSGGGGANGGGGGGANGNWTGTGGARGELAGASFEYENQGDAGQDSPEFGGVSVSGGVAGPVASGLPGVPGVVGQAQAQGQGQSQGTPEIFVRPGMGWKSALARARAGFGSPPRDGMNGGRSSQGSGEEGRNGRDGHGRSLSDRGLVQAQAQGENYAERQGYGYILGEQDPSLATLHILHSLKKDMITLWTDPGVKEVLKRRKVRLEEGSGFFLNDLPRLLTTTPPYLPTDDDVLRARLKTVGVSEYKFEMEVSAGRDQGTEWRIVDVGGSRSMRPTWVPFFDTVDAIIFLAPISGFDQVLLEDRSVNRLEDSVLLWKAVCSSKLLANVDLVLFLNKCDILERKLMGGVRMAKYVRSYGDRPNDLENVSKYLRGKFSAIHREYSPNPRKFYAFCTSVTDTATTAGIIASVRDMVIRQHLKQSKLL
ncbi:G-protein alpha subunit-domain-containing protein [Crepidotus variabilis]|uniref:G-protein alpha subunit-domain-containing protein n=1 Tax=Crepidotus variabilis TaxID=179855 RepID=A0A9P6EEQ1_9AGAR|nr:G-protein alpha subunit-domain-containing protein [Crepidotus variabilis]